MTRRTLINERYELAPQPIARGGMGEVWEGRDVKLDREVAVKFISFPDGRRDEELVRRFVRESRITARLMHPGVPAVFDVGSHEGRPFLVMQRIHGVSISDLIGEHGALPIGWATAIAAQTCAVLAVAHEASLVHRDLKPANLMLEPAGTVKVLDFGLAVALDFADLSQITRSGQTIGTPAYMAPEQVMAAMTGPHSDLYALGCTLHEMLTGQQLFCGSTAYSVMNKQVDERPGSMRDIRPEIPPALDQLVSDLLEKKPEGRPSSAQVVFNRLVPFVRDLGPLSGVLAPRTQANPVRMYASIVSRAGHDANQSDAPPAPGMHRADPPSLASQGEVERERADARSLVKQSRFGQAAELLQPAAHATRELGARDADAVDVRLELAEVLFEGGDYRRAGPVYQALAQELTQSEEPDADVVFRCRLQDATCRALIGDTANALRTLEKLLVDEQRVYGPDDPRTLELRRQIGLLQLGAGQRGIAATTLSELIDDLIQIYDTDHPMVAKIREVLGGILSEGDK